MKDDVAHRLDDFHFGLNKKGKIILYVVSTVLIAAGIIILSKPMAEGKVLTGCVYALCGVAVALCVHFHNKIPGRVKFYSAIFLAALGSLFLLLNAEDMTSNPYSKYYHCAPLFKVIGLIGFLLSTGGGIFVLYKDVKYHIRHSHDV